MTASRDRQWLIERVALGEAPEDVALTESERRRVEALASDDESIRAQYPKARVAAEIGRRLRVQDVRRSAARPRRWPAVLAPSLAIAAALVLWVRVDGGPSGGDPREMTRLKGAALVIHRKTTDGADLLRSQDVVVEGDRLQVSYRVDRELYAVVLSVDGRGVVTLHAPSDERQDPVRLEAGVHRLPFSYQLDDAPSFERFFLVTSFAPFSTPDIRRAAEQLGRNPAPVAARAPLSLPADLQQFDLLLMKGQTL